MEMRIQISSALFVETPEAQILEQILEDNKTISRIDILKVSHHGAKAALTNELAERLHPKISLISVGEENRYGRPLYGSSQLIICS